MTVYGGHGKEDLVIVSTKLNHLTEYFYEIRLVVERVKANLRRWKAVIVQVSNI